jgi:hypothetical protein
MPNATNIPKREFPPHPEVKRPAWISELSASGLIKFDMNRKIGIERDVLTLEGLIKDLPGLEGVSPESISYLATRWAINLADTYEEGTQHGIENEQDRRSRAYNPAANFAMMAISAGTGGLG